MQKQFLTFFLVAMTTVLSAQITDPKATEFYEPV
ncbi:MAG: hypothetical protein ACI819_001925, partial [Neolewinella sp.]